MPDDLVPPGDPEALAHAIDAALQDPTAMHDATARLQVRVRADFSADVMTNAVLAAYADALDDNVMVKESSHVSLSA